MDGPIATVLGGDTFEGKDLTVRGVVCLQVLSPPHLSAQPLSETENHALKSVISDLGSRLAPLMSNAR